MALDRFVYFDRMPHMNAIQDNLDGYLFDFGAEVKWDKDRWFVTLPGKPEIDPRIGARLHDERWFEVWIGEDCVDVITRQTDELTNVIAEGFARRIARKLQGRKDWETA